MTSDERDYVELERKLSAAEARIGELAEARAEMVSQRNQYYDDLTRLRNALTALVKQADTDGYATLWTIDVLEAMRGK